ncbi:MAG: hypothetical protein HY074_06185 [Deltaproteobacteria bacterium]|nr:hypothetical protein [Deltaproteobacteria bacterium]
MTPGRTLRAQLVFMSAAALVVTVLTYSVVVFRDIDTEKDLLVRNDLRELTTLNARLDSDILEARDALRPNYDDVADTAKGIQAAVQALDAGRLGQLRAANSKIDEAFRALYDQLARKVGLLDDIKFRHAVAMNSSRFFPMALSDVKSTNPSILRDRLDLETGILNYMLTAGANQEALDALIKQLKTDAAALGNEELQIAVRHAAKLAAVFPALNHDTQALLEIPTGASIAALKNEYNRGRTAHEEQAHWVRLALALTSIVLLVSFAFVIRQIWRTNASAQRFVPIELLNILGRSSLAEVKRGDAVALEMHILFADIRRFSERMEKSSPAEAFAFMNEYLAAMGAPIAQFHGFITEYRGDGIFALFPGKADDAVAAAQGMLKALAQLNQGRAAPVEIGVGVHSGGVMLGTFGATERLNAGVISVAVVMAARLEGLTKQYKAPLLVSETTYQRLTPEKLRLRQVDQVQVLGVSNPTFIYDVPAADVHAAYDEAMALYRARQFESARAKFERIADDPVSASLAKRCASYQAAPPPPQWQGVFEANEK